MNNKMTFAQKRKASGFKTQTAFANFIGRSILCVKLWESENQPNRPDKMAEMILNAILNGADRDDFSKIKSYKDLEK